LVSAVHINTHICITDMAVDIDFLLLPKFPPKKCNYIGGLMPNAL
jgi:hypothetical protein